MREQKKYVTAKEAMDKIKTLTGQTVSKHTFYKWLKDGMIAQKRLGKKILIAVSDLDIFLSDFRETSKLLARKAA